MHIRVDQDFLQADITDPCILGSDALASAGVTDSIAKRLTLLKDRRLCQPTSRCSMELQDSLPNAAVRGSVQESAASYAAS